MTSGSGAEPTRTTGSPMAGWVKAGCILVAIQHATSALIEMDSLFHGSDKWRAGILALNLLVVFILGRAIDERRRLTWRFGFLPTWSAET